MRYDCINDYSGFMPNLSTIGGLNPGDPIEHKQNDFLFFNKTQSAHINNDDNKRLNRLRNQFDKQSHSMQSTNCKYNHINTDGDILEGFESGLIDTVSLMGDKINEANRNMRIILESNSSLVDFENEQNIKQKELDDKKYIAKQRQQDEKMESINKHMSEIEVLRGQVMTEFDKLKGIQAQVSGKKLSVNVLDENGTFQIKGNNKCLSYKDEGDYKFSNCYTPDTKQHFKMNYISNSNNYKYVLDNNTNIKANQPYPFYVVQPVNDHKQCLHAGEGDDAVNISVQPCAINDNQKWNKVDSSMGCR